MSAMWPKLIVNARKSERRVRHTLDRVFFVLVGTVLIAFAVASILFGPAFWRDSQSAAMPPLWQVRGWQIGAILFGLGTVIAAVVHPTSSRVDRFLSTLTLAGQLIIFFTFLLVKIVLR